MKSNSFDINLNFLHQSLLDVAMVESAKLYQPRYKNTSLKRSRRQIETVDILFRERKESEQNIKDRKASVIRIGELWL